MENDCEEEEHLNDDNDEEEHSNENIDEEKPSNEDNDEEEHSNKDNDEQEHSNADNDEEEHSDEDKDEEEHSNKDIDEERKFQCIECVNIVQVFSSDEIENGDHIVFRKAMYDHHGIIVSKCRGGMDFWIAEATNSYFGASLGILSSLSLRSKAKISITLKTIDFHKEHIGVVKYEQPFSKTKTIKRAISLFKDDKFKYNLLSNNCEHFATSCVTGKTISVQVNKFHLTRKLLFKLEEGILSNEKNRNEQLHDHGLLCRNCFEKNVHLLDVNTVEVEKADDIEKGDIIRYKYYGLWHEAVVLEKLDTTERSVALSIAHYAFCGVRSHRTIIAEDKKFMFSGNWSKLDYAAPKYDTYPPDIVVDRARERIKEQFFAFFSNDSSHFVRWCKLKTS